MLGTTGHEGNNVRGTIIIIIKVITYLVRDSLIQWSICQEEDVSKYFLFFKDAGEEQKKKKSKKNTHELSVRLNEQAQAPDDPCPLHPHGAPLNMA